LQLTSEVGLQDLLRQISDNKVAYMSLQDSYEKALTEINTLKEALENHMKGSSNARGQLQRMYLILFPELIITSWFMVFDAISQETERCWRMLMQIVDK
jgi:succinate dehydrogenase/fumarate reductase flavoprotein subunit